MAIINVYSYLLLLRSVTVLHDYPLTQGSTILSTLRGGFTPKGGTMHSTTRREFLKSVAAGSVVTGASLCCPNIVRAVGVWGDVPSGVWATPPDIKILEVHLLGGMAPFESFYFRPVAGL